MRKHRHARTYACNQDKHGTTPRDAGMLATHTFVPVAGSTMRAALTVPDALQVWCNPRSSRSASAASSMESSAAGRGGGSAFMVTGQCFDHSAATALVVGACRGTSTHWRAWARGVMRSCRAAGRSCMCGGAPSVGNECGDGWWVGNAACQPPCDGALWSQMQSNTSSSPLVSLGLTRLTWCRPSSVSNWYNCCTCVHGCLPV